MSAHFRRRLWSVVFIIGFFVIWEALCWLFNVSDIIVPKPSQIIYTLVTRMPALWPHTVQTLYTTLVGFAFGIAVGVFLGMSSARRGWPMTLPIRC